MNPRGIWNEFGGCICVDMGVVVFDLGVEGIGELRRKKETLEFQRMVENGRCGILLGVYICS